MKKVFAFIVLVAGLASCENNSDELVIEGTVTGGEKFIVYENKPEKFTAIDTITLEDGSFKIGLELDLDSIKNMPVSATTPIGFSEEQIRKFIFELSKQYSFHYFHICEGAPTNDTERNTVGKSIAYFVKDFINYSI